MHIILKCLVGISIIIFIICVIYAIIHIIRIDNYSPFSEKDLDLDFLNNVLTTLKENNIETFPVYGTLLGLQRHNSRIPWDDDVDICINKNDIPRLKSLDKLLNDKGLYLIKVKIPFEPYFYKICRLGDKRYNFLWMNWSWPFVDIFPYSIKGDKVKIHANGEKNMYNKDDIFPINKSILINNKVLFNLPNKPENLLDKMYGKNWANICVSGDYNHTFSKVYRKNFKIPCKTIQNNIDYTDLFNNCWVINLDKDTKRMETTTERLTQLEIVPNRWKATHYNTDECQKVYKQYLKLPENIIRKISTRLKMGPYQKISEPELACFMSHTKLWEYLYEKNVENAIIFEDDIIFSKDLRKQDIIDTIENSKGFNIIWLGHCNDLLPIKVTQPGTSLCLHAYVVSSFALEKLVNFKSKIDKVDYIIRTFCKKNLCFKAGDKRNKDVSTFGHGIIHQDNMFNSNLNNTH